MHLGVWRTARSQKPRLNGVRPGRPEQSRWVTLYEGIQMMVSMKSGLEDRNNVTHARHHRNGHHLVSMKSGLEGRNNIPLWRCLDHDHGVSMKSGLEGRNNASPPKP